MQTETNIEVIDEITLCVNRLELCNSLILCRNEIRTTSNYSLMGVSEILELVSEQIKFIAERLNSINSKIEV